HAPEVRAVAVARRVHEPAAAGRDPGAGGHHGEALVAFLELTKPRITQLVMLTAAAGFYLGAAGRVDVRVLIETLLGVALVAAGTNAFNQLRERDVDARMQRTRGRPLPSGRVTPRAAAVFAAVISIAGVADLGIADNLLTAGLAGQRLATAVRACTRLTGQ